MADLNPEWFRGAAGAAPAGGGLRLLDRYVGEPLRRSFFPTPAESKVDLGLLGGYTDPAQLEQALYEQDVERSNNPLFNDAMEYAPLLERPSARVTPAGAGPAGGGAPAKGASGGQGPAASERRGRTGAEAKTPRLDAREPIFPEPAAFPAFSPGPEAPAIHVIRDAQGRVISASNIRGSEAGQPGSELAGPPAEVFPHEDPNEPLNRRRHAFMAALDAHDPNAEGLFEQMSPAEQRLAEERLAGGAGMMLGQREHERELARRERAGVRGIETGLEVKGLETQMQEDATRRRVLGDSSPDEWIADRAIGYAKDWERRALADPAGREKRGLDPTKLKGEERRAIAEQAAFAAKRELEYLLFTAQFPQALRYGDREPEPAVTQP